LLFIIIKGKYHTLGRDYAIASSEVAGGQVRNIGF
jgi:hypothetical protein